MWLAPLLLLLAALYLYPLIDVTRLSLTDATDAATPAHYTFASYRSLLGSVEFLAMTRVTGIFVAASIAGQLLFGLMIAALVCAGERRRLPGAALVRAIVLVGWVLPGVVIGIVWKLLLDESGAGIMAYAASLLGIAQSALPVRTCAGAVLGDGGEYLRRRHSVQHDHAICRNEDGAAGAV